MGFRRLIIREVKGAAKRVLVRFRTPPLGGCGVAEGRLIKTLNWFNSENTVGEKLNFDFPHKNTILGLMMKIEEMRNPLCYGAPRADVAIDAMTMHFHELKELMEREVGETLG